MKTKQLEERRLVNCYICDKCGQAIVTIEYAEGATPYIIECDKKSIFGDCNGDCQSSFKSNPQNLIPTATWYRKDDNDPMNFAERRHHENGGLFLRDLTEDEIIGYIKRGFHRGI